jgi:hypothetical protein
MRSGRVPRTDGLCRLFARGIAMMQFALAAARRFSTLTRASVVHPHPVLARCAAALLCAGIALALTAPHGLAQAQTAPDAKAGAAPAQQRAQVRDQSSGRPSGKRNPALPLVSDGRLVASPAQPFIGPAGTSNPFPSGTAMTENQCTSMENCQVVQGQGPSYATWCRCGKGKLTTFTYIHD